MTERRQVRDDLATALDVIEDHGLSSAQLDSEPALDSSAEGIHVEEQPFGHASRTRPT